MSLHILILALMVGAANWAFRYGPTRLSRGAGQGTGPLARFLSATGPAAIATLVVASLLPMALAAQVVPLIAGVASVVALWLWRRSVVIATLGGSLAYALATMSGTF
ncbi:MAG: L-valine transporter subunit YgaH [Rhodobacteraceae bacterium PARR1]|nr:MAG: L-valine transporter subunit YgaH [Rhodobacteraceae bacterium PARR1]